MNKKELKKYLLKLKKAGLTIEEMVEELHWIGIGTKDLLPIAIEADK